MWRDRSKGRIRDRTEMTGGRRSRNRIAVLKGPKHEIFESKFFTQIKPVWLGDLGTGEKN
jgi:hypothetical protein